jgi:hypothetical protein
VAETDSVVENLRGGVRGLLHARSPSEALCGNLLKRREFKRRATAPPLLHNRFE